MQREMELKNRMLAEKALLVVQKNEFITSIADQLIAIRKELPEQCGNVLDRMEKIMRSDLDSNIWREFELRFREVHQKFYHELNRKYPDLTPAEKKLATLLRLNLSTKDIAAITYLSPDSIKVARSRLRKKLGLAPEEDIVGFLERLG
jgi:DNA-binding CsgD family transcriptional regulator